MRVLTLLPFLAACSGVDDVVGPFTGATHRWAIDHYTLASTTVEAKTLGDDLDGNGTIDNDAGLTFASVAGNGDLTPSPSSMIAAGVLPTMFVIQADTLDDDASVGVSYIGRPGDTAVAVGGRFVGGDFTSNRSTSSHGAEGTFVLPVFMDADPLAFTLDHAEIDLTRDSTGYTGLIRGEIPAAIAIQVAAAGLQQMVMSDPINHTELGSIFDTNGDGRVTIDEVANNALIRSLLAADVNTDGAAFVSVGFGVHLIPCDTGACLPTTIDDRCHDRILDGNETDVDCGGSCRACGFDATCAIGSDCESGVCATGVCADPTCTDHIQDGLERGVDCGSTCGGCSGDPCGSNDQCHSNVCNAAGKCS